MSKQFWVFYTEGGCLTLQGFETLEERTNWIGFFTLKYLDNPEDNVVEFIFQGTPEIVGPGTKRVED
jgi:hypothetical protein